MIHGFRFQIPVAIPQIRRVKHVEIQGAARLVQVDPRSMSAMVLPEAAELLVPDLTDARRNSSLWEAYQGEIEPAIGERQVGWG